MTIGNLSSFDMASTRYIPVPDWNKYHEWPKLGGLRHLIFHSKKNKFDSVIKRVGRRVLIDETAFFVWVQNQGSGGASDGK